MKYTLAILLCGQPFSAGANLFLCIMLWVPGVIHAFLIVSDHNQAREIKTLRR